MNKIIAGALTSVYIIISVPLLQASDRCLNITVGNVGQLTMVDCENAWSSLGASGVYPDIFSSTPANLSGICFVSNGDIPATLGGNAVNISTISAWTNEFGPASLGLGTDNVVAVITQWTVKDWKNRVIGNLYTHDVVDTLASSELDVVRFGTGKLFGAKGAFKVSSLPRIDSAGLFAGVIDIISASGQICLPGISRHRH